MDSLVRKSSRVQRIDATPMLHRSLSFSRRCSSVCQTQFVVALGAGHRELVTVRVDASVGLRSGCRPSTVPIAPGRGAGNLWSARLLFFRERHVCVASG